MELRKVLSLALLLLSGAYVLAAEGAGPLKSHVTQVKVSPSTFLPSLGSKVQITAELTAAGRLRAEVLDRDAFVVRTLVSGKKVAAGRLSLTWDGRDDSGHIVPDEAYSFRLDLRTPKGSSLYFPADAAVEKLDVPATYYSRTDATLVYELTKASRVHAQAGESEFDPQLGRRAGPVLKTIVNREPRPAGRVVDHWNGRDETGALLVSELPHFVVAIAAWPLPENSVIATGNRDVRFVDYALSRKGVSRLSARRGRGRHHSGLSTLDDISPTTTILVRNGVRTNASGCWQVASASAALTVTAEGPTAPYFRKQPGTVYLYEGVKQLGEYRVRPIGVDVALALGKPLTKRRTFAVNWASDLGPTAPGTFCLEPRESGAIAKGRSEQ